MVASIVNVCATAPALPISSKFPSSLIIKNDKIKCKRNENIVISCVVCPFAMGVYKYQVRQRDLFYYIW